MIRGFQVLIHMYKLLVRAKFSLNKWWVRPVPAAAVIPAPQVGTRVIGPKAFVAGRINLL